MTVPTIRVWLTPGMGGSGSAFATKCSGRTGHMRHG